ncbi:SMI1/KNR4 family protein [Candidatus Albibeggiatoa sp. nov. BB20]|uniref:SMI1/KNR4 family protein n=1 Tax=Candidatus Albibeggiatoa sp. nov. BB20 TaxID=3162723 RepID=UPI0033654166
MKKVELQFFQVSELDIQQLETNLGLHLPPSYKAFLQHTNGWPIAMDETLLPAQEVGFFSKRYPEDLKFLGNATLIALPYF